MTLSSHEEDIVRVNVSKWLELNKTMKTLQKQIRELKSAQKIVEGEIIRSMKSNDIPQFELPNGKFLKLTTKESKKSVTPKWIKSELDKCDTSQEMSHEGKAMVQEIISKIDNRETRTKETLVHKD